MSTVITRVAGHLITATREGGSWEAQIDTHLPVMEREFDLRSTYCSPVLEMAVNAAMCEVLGFAETIREGSW
jgi:hypothetical protein